MSISVTRRDDGSILVQCGEETIEVPAAPPRAPSPRPRRSRGAKAKPEEPPDPDGDPPPIVVTPPPGGLRAYLLAPGSGRMFADFDVTIPWIDRLNLIGELQRLGLGEKDVVRLSLPRGVSIDVGDVIAAAEPTRVSVVLDWDEDKEIL
jgi:hypothetical protein